MKTPMPDTPATAVYALTREGAALGIRIANAMNGTLFALARLGVAGAQPFDALVPLVGETWGRFTAHVFVSATGIAVRAVAPHLASKASDPAVACVDQRGRFAVSLVSGHLGGANALARQVAEITGGTAVISTATDAEGLPAVDELARERGLRVVDVSRVKAVSAAVLEGAAVPRWDPENLLCAPGDPAAAWFPRVERSEDLELGSPAVWVSEHTAPQPAWLWLAPRTLVLGIGCRAGCPADEIAGLVDQTLARHGLSPLAVGLVASVELKRGEPGLLATAHRLGAETIFYPTDALAAVAVPTPSPRVLNHIGTASVCEAAAILASEGKALLVTKTASRNATLAIARRKAPGA